MAVLQQVLRLPTQVTYEIDDFFISQTNQLAFQWVDSWPNWPHHCLILYGPKGCGKTHLAHLWRQKTDAFVLNYDKLSAQNLDDICQQYKYLVVEDVPVFFDETLLFHLYNAVQQAGGALLLTTQNPPQSWTIRLPDLKSRVQSCLWAEIKSADDDLLKAMIHKIFADEQLLVPEQVIDYLLAHLDRSFPILSQAIHKINHYAFATKKRINLTLVKEALAQEFSL
ncbi:MAG: DNA replication protein [Alphaproteobacteria bacterium]|nr:DNA replication protein [Alphaproteobacteria bacterium]